MSVGIAGIRVLALVLALTLVVRTSTSVPLKRRIFNHKAARVREDKGIFFADLLPIRADHIPD